MATFIGSDQEVLCSICAGHYDAPRKLQGCIHSFCKTCILTFVQNLKKEEKLGEEFDCPVCRLPSKSPEEDNITIDWVQSLDEDETLKTKLEKKEEYDSRWCSQCRYVNKYIKSKVYCVSCQECFCESCSNTLHSFKMNKKHSLIDMETESAAESTHEQAVNLVQKFLSCLNHPEKCVEFFCQDEDKFCCSTCVATEHKLCTKISSLQDLQDPDFSKLAGLSSNLSNHIQTITNLIKEKDVETRKMPEKLAAEFQTIKEKVIRLLDVTEECIAQDSKAYAKAISMKHSDEIQQLDDIAAVVRVVAYFLQNLLGKLPCYDARVCCKKAICLLQSLERKVMERCSGFETEEILLKTEDILETVLNLGPNETKSIISVQRCTKTFPFPRLDEKYLLRDGKVEFIAEKKCISDISPGHLSGYNSITYLPDNKIILTDSYHGGCLLMDTNAELVDSVDFSDEKLTLKSNMIDRNFIYASYLANDLIAVSSLAEKKIYFRSSLTELEEKGEIVCKYTPTAIHGLRNGDLCVLWNQPQAFGIISLCGGSYKERVYFKTDSEGRNIRHRRWMAVDENLSHVVVSHHIGTASEKKGLIVSYDFSGDRVYEYRHPEMITPNGMALDFDGNVYICEHTFGRIYVLSSEGLLIRIIKENCPAHPFAIGFSKTANIFAVSQATEKDCKHVVFFSVMPP